jgi:hypothetical protein
VSPTTGLCDMALCYCLAAHPLSFTAYLRSGTARLGYVAW